MLYRHFAPEDFVQLYAIEEVCFSPPFRFGRSYMRRLLSSSNAAAWIAEENGRMCGFAIVEWTRETDGTIGYIQTIEVAPDWRGQGIGGELLRRSEDSARAGGAQLIWLHVDAQNAGAIRLYQGRGYLLDGKEDGYYPNGREALIFSKPLEAIES